MSANFALVQMPAASRADERFPLAVIDPTMAMLKLMNDVSQANSAVGQTQATRMRFALFDYLQPASRGLGGQNLRGEFVGKVAELSAQVLFEALVRNWQEETRYISDTDKIESNSSFRKIIDMGSVVIPLILDRLIDGNVHWFSALAEIAGEDPVAPELFGDTAAMAAVWIEWWEQRAAVAA